MNDCEQTHAMISAALDDELSVEERGELQTHLRDCPACREMERRFAGVHQLVESHISSLNPRPLHPPQVAVWPPAVTHLTWIGMAAAAAVVLFVLSTVLVRSPQVHADELMRPLTEVKLISEQREAAQETVLQTLEWELRVLRLQLAEEATSAKRDQLATRLEELLARVDRAKRPTNALHP